MTEGCLRASNRAERPPAGDARGAACLPGAPFHTFTQADAAPLRPGAPERLRFELLPTAYSFAPVRRPGGVRLMQRPAHDERPCASLRMSGIGGSSISGSEGCMLVWQAEALHACGRLLAAHAGLPTASPRTPDRLCSCARPAPACCRARRPRRATAPVRRRADSAPAPRQGHCVRLALAGADAKHFYVDHAGPRTLWIHAGPGRPSCLSLPVLGSGGA